MPNIGVYELILILIIALVVFGPGKLPEVGKALGKGINEFKKATSNISEIKPMNTEKPESKGEVMEDA